MPAPPDLTLSTRLVDAAAHAIEFAVETHYTHELTIDEPARRYDVDCSGFVSFLVGKVAARHLAMITATITGQRPLAHDYYAFAAALPTGIEHGWQQIETLEALLPGDIVAWRLPVARTGDTGHVFVAASAPVASHDDASHSVEVFDATSIVHFDDSRGPGKRFANGIGTGSIHFRTDDAGRPTAFRFDARAPFETMPIAIARMEPFSAG